MIETIIAAHKYYVQGNDKFSVFDFLLKKILELTNSEYGFIGEVLYKDELPYLKTNAITNVAWTDELKETYKLHKNIGMSFMSLDNLFGLVITENKIIISNDPKTDKRRGGKYKIPDGHPPLKSFAGIPFYHNKKLIGMIGIANRENGYTKEFIDSLSPFYDTCSTLISAYKIKDDYAEIEHKHNNFMSEASHDMRTPLNGIMGYCQLLEMNIDKSQTDIHEYIKSISTCGNILLGLIDDILNISKTIIDIKIIDINLNDIINEHLEMIIPIAKRNNIKIICDIDHCDILVDKKMFGIILSNLFSNAIKYNNNGGTISIKTNLVDSENINIEISDTGNGIDKKDLESIFHPFYRGCKTNNIQGTGLGLSIVKKYIISMNGRIDVESTVGIGTKFIITLKYVNTTNKNTILYVEDDKINQLLMKNVMKLNHYKLDIIPNIKDAIKVINNYNIFIFDLNLPDGLGTDLLPYIKNKKNVIILTADASNNTEKNIRELGIEHFITKPFNVNNLLSIIQEFHN